jgi:hypothetical protein
VQRCPRRTLKATYSEARRAAPAGLLVAPRSSRAWAWKASIYLATLALDPTGRGRQRWNNRWKSALNEFDVLFDGRLTAGRV